ncbi:MAG: NAD(P)/FAD-dependent oxidoreductase [Xanthomonadales bacterium]|nr:NAD(P)/FAD-dependent oxidoreductase [Xanthomonadales bacterium]
MHIADAIVVGGGPAGSTCARKLKKAGLDVVVLDRASFPRTKLCAGWVTPRALADLELDPGDYPHSFMTFDALVLHWTIFTVKFTLRQHSIRRYEFDDFLLRRSGATVRKHKVREIRRDNGDFVVDGEYRGKFLVGAGGTSCPVYRAFFRQRYPRRRSLQAATLEQELAYDWQDPACHLWFFNDGLPGYAWYVPKANGHINIGLGGMAGQLKQQGGNLHDYWRKFTLRLNKRGLVVCDDLRPSGYSYFLHGGVDTASDRNAYLVGDAVGLATRDMCEGIGPAIESALLAAQSILTGSEYSLAGIKSLSGQSVISRHLERKFAG